MTRLVYQVVGFSIDVADRQRCHPWKLSPVTQAFNQHPHERVAFDLFAHATSDICTEKPFGFHYRLMNVLNGWHRRPGTLDGTGSSSQALVSIKLQKVAISAIGSAAPAVGQPATSSCLILLLGTTSPHCTRALRVVAQIFTTLAHNLPIAGCSQTPSVYRHTVGTNIVDHQHGLDDQRTLAVPVYVLLGCVATGVLGECVDTHAACKVVLGSRSWRWTVFDRHKLTAGVGVSIHGRGRAYGVRIGWYMNATD